MKTGPARGSTEPRLTREIEARIDRLHSNGIVDLHFDMPMDLYEKKSQPGDLVRHYLPELEAANVGVVGSAIYIEDRYNSDMALRVGLGQVATLYTEVEKTPKFAICKTFQEIENARAQSKIAVLITMEGVEPLGSDLNLLRVFYELGVRVIGLTHTRRNAAGSGGIFKPSGSSRDGLSEFGRDVVRECERLGIIVDLAHINPQGFDDIVALTTKPLIVSHTNARKFYDIERNLSDEQIKTVGQRGGVIGINAILVSADETKSTIDHYIDHIEHVAGLAGIDGVGIGFDFCEYLFRQLPEKTVRKLVTELTRPHFIPDLTNHSQARNLTRRLIERGFSDEQIEKILFRNWLRILEEILLSV